MYDIATSRGAHRHCAQHSTYLVAYGLTATGGDPYGLVHEGEILGREQNESGDMIDTAELCTYQIDRSR